MKRKFLWLGLSFLLVAALVLTGCPAPVVAEEVVEPVPEIGFISRLAVPYWVVCEAGFRDAAADFGFKPIVYQPPLLTVEDQIMVMETWIAMGIDGILVSPNDADAAIGVINQAIDAGIPVITFDVDSPGSKRFLFLGWPAYSYGVSLGKGQLAVMELAGISPPGKITFSTGEMKSERDVQVHQGWRDIIEAAGYEAVEPLLDGGDAAIAFSLAETAIELYPDLVGMTTFYDYTAPAVGKAVTDAGKIDILPVHSMALMAEQVPYLETGAIDTTTDMAQYGGAYLSAEILYKLIQAGRENWDDVLKEYQPEYPAEKVRPLSLGLVTYEKVDVEMWPEIAWIKTLAEWKEDFPRVWDIISH